MGLHTGEPAVGDERYVGLGVHRAARIGAVGHGGQIVLSNATRELVEDEVGGVSVRDLGSYRLKDIDRPEKLFQVDIDGLPTEFPPLSAETAAEPHPLRRRALLAAALAGVLAAAVVGVFALAGNGPSTPTVLPNSVIRIAPHTLKVTQVTPVGDAPDLVIASGGYLWITNHILRDTDSGALRYAGDHTLTRVDPSTRKAVVVGGGLAPCGITADPSGDVWVANCYPSALGLRDDIVRVDAKTLEFKKTLPAPGGDGFFRGLVYGGGSLWASQIVGGDVANADTVTQIDAQTGKERTIHLTREANELAWSGGYGDLWIDNFSDGSLTRLHPATGAARTVGVGEVATQPTALVVDGSVVWVADWASPRARPPQRGRIASDSPHLPANGRPGDWCLGRRDGRGRRLGDDAARPRAVADRSEDEQRQAREPSRPADRRRSRRQRRLGDVAKTMINRYDQGAGLGQSTASALATAGRTSSSCPAEGSPLPREAFVPYFQFSHEKWGLKHGSDGTRTRAASGGTVLFDR